ncbi:MAG: hypothetical protein JXR36_09795 [Bacteroidales bacterium]|nr:hypothetical protein [Bacteroidales bacterium]
MNSLSKSISEIFNGRKIESKYFSENYLLNKNTGTKKYYEDLIKEYNLTPEYRTENQINKLNIFSLNQSLRDVLKLINNEFFVIHKTTEKIKILKFIHNNKNVSHNYELHFVQNKMFLISLCISTKDTIGATDFNNQAVLSFHGIDLLRQSCCLSDKSNNIIMTENKLLQKIYLFNKADILNLVREV